MHTYLRAIGFSNLNKRAELDQLVGMIMTAPTSRTSYMISEKEQFVEISKDFSERAGITVCGIYDEKGFFHLEHYYPYFRARCLSVKEEIAINRKVDNLAYSGMCDDMRFGVSLVFYLQNPIEYLKFYEKMKESVHIHDVMFSGLSIEGKIILPVNKTLKSKEHRDIERLQYNKLISEAKEGNQDAIDNLALQDIHAYAMVSKRSKVEDIYSIVDTTLFPYGSESDNYSLVGTIIDYKLYKNDNTLEESYELLIECNDVIFDVCINKNDLHGVPMKGARFKGVIWLQGKVIFK